MPKAYSDLHDEFIKKFLESSEEKVIIYINYLFLFRLELVIRYQKNKKIYYTKINNNMIIIKKKKKYNNIII